MKKQYLNIPENFDVGRALYYLDIEMESFRSLGSYMPREVKGYSVLYPGHKKPTIAIKEENKSYFGVLVHEMAHCVLGHVFLNEISASPEQYKKAWLKLKNEVSILKDTAVREIEAEGTALMIRKHYGMDTYRSKCYIEGAWQVARSRFNPHILHERSLDAAIQILEAGTGKSYKPAK